MNSLENDRSSLAASAFPFSTFLTLLRYQADRMRSSECSLPGSRIWWWQVMSSNNEHHAVLVVLESHHVMCRPLETSRKRPLYTASGICFALDYRRVDGHITTVGHSGKEGARGRCNSPQGVDYYSRMSSPVLREEASAKLNSKQQATAI